MFFLCAKRGKDTWTIVQGPYETQQACLDSVDALIQNAAPAVWGQLVILRVDEAREIDVKTTVVFK